MIKSHRQVETARLMRQATYASVAAAAVIIAMKLYAWFMTDSLSLLTSLVDSFFDISVSAVNLAAVRYALTPADEDHRFGHGKAEDLAALLQGAFIAGSGLFIAFEAVDRLLHPVAVKQGMVGVVVILLSSLVIIALVSFQRYVVRQTGSTAIEADSIHYSVDLASNGLVLVAIMLSAFGGVALADPLLAMVIAAYILHGAWGVAKKSFDHLMDREFDECERQKIIAIVLAHRAVKGMHDLRTRRSGVQMFIQLHAEMDGHLPLHQAHQTAEEITQSLLKEYPGAQVLIHQDPEAPEPVALALGQVLPVDRR